MVSESQLCSSKVRQLPWGVRGPGGDTVSSSGTGCAALVGVLEQGDGLAARTTPCPFPGLVPATEDLPDVPPSPGKNCAGAFALAPSSGQCWHTSLWPHRIPSGSTARREILLD